VAATAKAKPTVKKSAPPPATAAPSAPEVLPVQLIALDQIADDGHNHRLDEKDKAAIEDLVQDFSSHGKLLQPIKVFRGIDGRWHPIFGFRRIQAAKRVGWKEIPAQIRASIPTDAERHTERAIENLKRKNLTPAEETVAVHEMVEAHTPMLGRENAIKRSAEELGWDPGEVTKRLYVFDRLSPKARELLGQGKLNIHQARELVKFSDVKIQDQYACQIAQSLKRDSLTPVSVISGWVENEKRSLASAQWNLGTPIDRPAGKQLACSACRFNTANDKGLFDTSKEEAERGCCTHRVCYEFSQERVARENKKTAETIGKWIDKGDTPKDQAGNIQVVKAAAPSFVKPEVAQRFVKKELGIQPAKGAAAAEAKESPEKKENAERRKALLACGVKYGEWQELVSKSIEAAYKKCLLLKNAAILLGACCLDAHNYRYPSQDYELRGRETFDPPEEKPMTSPQSRLISSVKTIRLAADGNSDAVCIASIKELAKEANPNLDSYDAAWSAENGLDCGPEMAVAIAKAFGVDPPAPPRFEDFLPKPAAAAGSDLVGKIVAYKSSAGKLCLALVEQGPRPDGSFLLHTAENSMIGSKRDGLKPATAQQQRDFVKVAEWFNRPLVAGDLASNGMMIVRVKAVVRKGESIDVEKYIVEGPGGDSWDMKPGMITPASKEDAAIAAKAFQALDDKLAKKNGKAAPSKNGSGIDEAFASGKIVALKTGGDLGLSQGVVGDVVSVRWAEDGQISTVKPAKLRTANKHEAVDFADKATWWKPGQERKEDF
jgi:ParB/RepB/Spo0J family partition protein